MQRLIVDKLHSLEGHKDAIYALIKDETSTKFYTSGGDGFVVEWDLDHLPDGNLIAKVDQSVYALALYHNILIIGHNYHGVHLVDRVNKKEILNIKISNQAIFDLKVKSHLLYVALADGELVTIDLKYNEIINRKHFLKERIRRIAFFENKIYLACSDCSVKIINDQFELLENKIAHKKSVMAIDIYEKKMISAGRDALITFWHNEKRLTDYHQIPAHMYAINDLVISPNEKYFATCSIDKTIKIWDTKAMRLLKVIDKNRSAGHGTSVNKLFWINNNQLVSCSDDRTVSIWQIK